jgi:ATP-binding cassette subfamily B protein
LESTPSGRDRGPRKVSAAEKAQARQVSLRRVGALFARHRGALAAVTAIIVVSSVLAMASPFLLRAVIDRALPERDLTLLVRLVAGMVAVAAVTSVLGVAQTWISTRVGQQVMHRLRTDVFTHLQRQSLAFFTRTRTGEVQSRITNDIGGMQSVVTSTATSIASNLTTVVATAVAMVALSWRLSLVSLVVLPPAVWLTRRVAHLRREITARRQRELADLNVTVEEGLSVSGVHLAKTLGTGPALAARFAASSARLVDLELRSELAGRWRMASMNVVFAAIPAVIYLSAGLPGAAGTLSIGTLVAFTALQGGLFRPLMGLLNVGVSVTASLALFARIFEYLDLPVDVDDPPTRSTSTPAGSAATCASPTSPSATRAATPPPSPGSPSTCRPAPGWPWSARPAPARAPWPRWSAACTTRPAAGSPSTASTCATCAWATWRRSSAWSARRPTCCTPPCGRTCATPAPRPPTPRSRPPPAPPGSTT